MKTLQRVHTLQEIVDLIRAMPVSAFDDDSGINRVKIELDSRRRDWIASDEYANQIYDENKKLEARRKKDSQRLAEREQHVKDWLKAGKLVKGMFIKVTGTRDGHGIREFLEVTDGRLVCRQWTVVRRVIDSRYAGAAHRDPRDKTFSGCKQLFDGTWIKPETQITTHDFCRVAKILTPSILG